MLISDQQWSVFLDAFGPMRVPEAVRSGLAQYLHLLLEENKNLNLTSITDWDEGVWKHLYDSLLVLRGEPEGVVLDWGTGGGTPGLPLSVWATNEPSPVSRVVMLDSVGKKVRAVESFISNMGLGAIASGVNTRGEEYVRKHNVSTVVMRAVAPPDRAIGWVTARVPRWIFMVGPQSLPLWEQSLKKFKNKGLNLHKNIEESLPSGLGKRHILVFTSR